MPQSPLGWIHIALALAAMAAGAAVGLAAKGTTRHLWLGRTYAFLMLGVNGTAFMLFGLFGRFGPFHVAALLSLLTVVAGWIPARSRSSRRWGRTPRVFHEWVLCWTARGGGRRDT